jgi:hypothetical protein
MPHYEEVVDFPLNHASQITIMPLRSSGDDPAVDRFQLDLVAAAVNLATERAADEVALDLQAEIIVDAAVDRLRLEIAAQQGLLGDLDDVVGHIEDAGAKLASELGHDLADTTHIGSHHGSSASHSLKVKIRRSLSITWHTIN